MFSLKKRKTLENNRATVADRETPAERTAINKEVSQYLAAIRMYESETVNQIRHSEQRAWKITGASVAVTVLALVAIAGLTPLKTVKPYVIRVDNSTGFTEVAQPLADGKATYGQAIDKYFVSRFVINRESYDWNTIQPMYDAVKLLSSSSVASQYDNIINNKQFSPLYLLKQDKRVMVNIIGVSFIDQLAQVRFIKYVQNADGSPAPDYQPSNWIATIGFDYDKKISYEKDRLTNPLGFEVTSYRVDPENVPGEGGK